MSDSTPTTPVQLDTEQLQELAAEVAKQLAGWLVNQVPGQITVGDPLALLGQQVSPPTGEVITVDPQFPTPAPEVTP